MPRDEQQQQERVDKTAKNQQQAPVLSREATVRFPRRASMQRWHPAERAIYDAVQAVELVGADVRLTDAVRLLQQARDKVADYVDATITTGGTIP